MKQFTKIMKALSDSNRIKIVKLLQRKSLCVCEIQALLGVSQPTVSSHLKVLEEAGLVSYQKEGLWVNYHATNGESSPYAASLLGNLRHWLNDDPEIMPLLKNLPGVSREEICKKSV